jgi:23S rRNA (uridine2552-2'-O)-methyltransferase
LDDNANGVVDVVVSDMAPNTVGHQKTDHLRQMVLLEYAFDFACRALRPGGTFVAKSFTGGTTNELLKQIKQKFESVHHVKPAASRKDSVEMFIVGLGFKNNV